MFDDAARPERGPTPLEANSGALVCYWGSQGPEIARIP